MKLFALCKIGLVIASPMGATSVGAHAAPVVRNLVATPQIKTALRTAHLRTVAAADRAKTRGPLRGSTYYGSYGTRRYALATFSHPRVGTTDQPELFSKLPGHPWRDRGDSGGCLTKGVIPSALVRLWRLRSYC